jgi:four helix bundle protein
MHNFQKLDVWNVSMELSTAIHEVTKDFPKQEIYGMTSQMRRASVSIPSNIAEGSGRKGNKELVQFLFIANGSAFELYTQIILSYNVGYISKETKEELLKKLSSIQKMLYALIQKFS